MKIWKINHMDDDKGINKVKWLSWQENFNESNKMFFFLFTEFDNFSH